MQEIQFIPFSECAVLLSFGNTIDNAIHEKLMLAKKIIEENPFPGFIETVPAYNSLTVFYNPAETTKTAETISASVIQQLKQTIESAEHSSVQKITASTITIPVCYDEEYGIDLTELSEQLTLSAEEIVELHTKQVYKVFMIGFTPGFPYMGILNEKLFTKRKTQPRISVAPGSVAIAGNQTGIYPLSTPGGWNIIGRTPLKIFDQPKENPFLLKAGDTIQFTSITKKEYEAWLVR
ncbi:MAG: 5-oxoprolinase subunit PxpB [Chitinophagaceae bacterium]|nr:5-oxoprolinase subunit PxpB [Chitinophagaceae bacterium]